MIVLMCLKVLSYWNLNGDNVFKDVDLTTLKVLSYWNLNFLRFSLLI